MLEVIGAVWSVTSKGLVSVAEVVKPIALPASVSGANGAGAAVMHQSAGIDYLSPVVLVPLVASAISGTLALYILIRNIREDLNKSRK